MRGSKITLPKKVSTEKRKSELEAMLILMGWVEGHVLRYTLYLKSRGNPEESVSVLHAPAREIIRSARSPGSPTDNGGSSENRPLSRRGSETSDFSDDELHSAPKLEGIPPPPEALPPGLRKKPWEFDLDQGMYPPILKYPLFTSSRFPNRRKAQTILYGRSYLQNTMV